MLENALGILVAAIIAALIALPLGPALKKRPWIFYAASLALAIVYIVCRNAYPRNDMVQALMPLFQKGYVAIWLLAIVMLTGVLDEGGPARKRLQPIRGELSILSFIFIIPHVWIYLAVYIPRFATLFSSRSNVAASLLFAMVLTALFAILTVTSLQFVRSHMSTRGWKRLQRLSYLMVALVFVHIVFVLGRSAFAAGEFTAATMSVIVYGLVIVAYAILRVRKHLRDKQRKHATV